LDCRGIGKIKNQIMSNFFPKLEDMKDGELKRGINEHSPDFGKLESETHYKQIARNNKDF